MGEKPTTAGIEPKSHWCETSLVMMIIIITITFTDNNNNNNNNNNDDDDDNDNNIKYSVKVAGCR